MPQPGEASVEEILESIKKVIARDNRAVASEARARRGRVEEAFSADPADAEEAEEVLDLDEAAMVGEDDADAAVDVSFEDKDDDARTRDEEVGADDVASGRTVDSESPLLNAAASDAMRDNLAALAMLAQPPASPQIVRSGETSLEGLVRDMLRPMLADWLDKNLPQMVERMVQAEIARIAGKRDR